MSRFYVTTPIYYVNDIPHLGTSYTTIAADAVRRYHLLRGETTRMLTGTDEHGQKLEREAQERGMPPEQFVREMSDRFEAAWPKLEVCADDFVRTTQPRHEKRVQELWRRIEARGDLELGSYEGWYCVPCEEFKTEKDLLPGNLCPLHLRPVEWQTGETYYFKLSRYEQRLLEHYRAHPDFVEPDTRLNEVVSFVGGGLKDLSVSRNNFTWGIPVPGNPKHVMYVWFDALANYWSVLQGDESLEKFWNDGTVVHLVGKDILRFHAVYWPAFLMSAGLPLPTKVFAHGFLTFNGQKMSKSLRNAVDPIAIARAFGEVAGGDEAGADVLRYQLLRAIAFGQDGDFDLGAMVERYNADLGKNLGNLLSRTLGLCAKLTGGRAPPAGERTELEETLSRGVLDLWARALEHWDKLEPHRALEAMLGIASLANQYVDRAAPWAEGKRGRQARVDAILASLLSVLEGTNRLLWPVLPAKSDAMRVQLGLSPLQPGDADLLKLPATLLGLPPGQSLPGGPPLFPTIDEDRSKALVERLTPAEAAPTPTSTSTSTSTPTSTATPTPISYDQFAAVDLRVGVVRSCERVPKKDKLLKLAVDLGEPAPRSIVAGLALSFRPEDLVGRRVVVVANLAPREFGKGLVSHGMLLATGPSEKLVLATVDGDPPAGSRLK